MTDLEVKKRAYIDYKQLERKLLRKFGMNYIDIKQVYDYINNMSKYNKSINFTNVDLKEGYFDFNYNDMCLTISKYNEREVYLLSDSIELWNNESLIGNIGFEELEKEVLSYV